jgi:hypothetical protein
MPSFITNLLQILFNLFKNSKIGFGAVDIASYEDTDPAELTTAVTKASGKEKLPEASGEYTGRHPLAKKYRNLDFLQGSRAFGSHRANTTRIHAGCDLYAPAGSKVYAIDDGVVLHYYDYYAQTWALVVQHGDKVVLYGEVQPPKDAYKGTDVPDPSVTKGLPNGVRVGAKVYKDQHIAYVGQLRFMSTKTNRRFAYKHQMLHFEMYKGTEKGFLTQTKNKTFDFVPPGNYQRRRDLIDPSEFLKQVV